MKAKPEISHLLLSFKTPKKALLKLTEKLLAVQIDFNLTFDEHISSICNKIGTKNKCTQPPCHLIRTAWQ